jgi:alanine dehydrogenase
MPPRTIARGEGAWLRSLTAVPSVGRYMGAKIFGGGRSKAVNYVVVLFDQASGEIAAFVDGHVLTAYRTAATSAVAVDRLAPAGPAGLAVLGSGLEARNHVRAISTVRTLSSVSVFSPTARNREAFAESVTDSLGVPCQSFDSAERAVQGATIVVAAARSVDESPILHGRWLESGMMVVSIGSTVPEQREIATDVIEKSDLIVCDMVDEVVHETGDMIAARDAGIVLTGKILSLDAAMSRDSDMRIQSARLPLFKSVGSALQDVAAAELALDLAIADGSAQPLPIQFLAKRI